MFVKTRMCLVQSETIMVNHLTPQKSSYSDVESSILKSGEALPGRWTHRAYVKLVSEDLGLCILSHLGASKSMLLTPQFLLKPEKIDII